jgi:hypothetical protein
MRRGDSEEPGKKVRDVRKAERDSVRLAGADQLVPVPFYIRGKAGPLPLDMFVGYVMFMKYDCVGDLQGRGLFCT